MGAATSSNFFAPAWLSSKKLSGALNKILGSSKKITGPEEFYQKQKKCPKSSGIHFEFSNKKTSVGIFCWSWDLSSKKLFSTSWGPDSFGFTPSFVVKFQRITRFHSIVNRRKDVMLRTRWYQPRVCEIECMLCLSWNAKGYIYIYTYRTCFLWHGTLTKKFKEGQKGQKKSELKIKKKTLLWVVVVKLFYSKSPKRNRWLPCWWELSTNVSWFISKSFNILLRSRDPFPGHPTCEITYATVVHTYSASRTVINPASTSGGSKFIPLITRCYTSQAVHAPCKNMVSLLRSQVAESF